MYSNRYECTLSTFLRASHTEEIAFARSAGFDCVQFAVREPGDYASRLGASLEALSRALQDANLASVMEIVVRIDQSGRNAIGQTPLDVLQANLPVISALACTCVHWHLVPTDRTLDTAALHTVEDALTPQFLAGVELAAEHGFRFGFEHNEPALGLFATPERCARMLNKAPALGFVWDFNHTVPEHLDGFLQLTPRMTMLHVSDTPLPTVNHHLPLGKGNLDFSFLCRGLLNRDFCGPAILKSAVSHSRAAMDRTPTRPCLTHANDWWLRLHKRKPSHRQFQNRREFRNRTEGVIRLYMRDFRRPS